MDWLGQRNIKVFHLLCMNQASLSKSLIYGWDIFNRDLALFLGLRYQSYYLFLRILGNKEFGIIQEQTDLSLEITGSLKERLYFTYNQMRQISDIQLTAGTGPSPKVQGQATKHCSYLIQVASPRIEGITFKKQRRSQKHSHTIDLVKKIIAGSTYLGEI